ncbi:MAG: serine/threonine-protein kinase [Deltaproteobacteria bacterium]|nr:serine/threonine-protein kinase [Deltaproteobacteria bacterium]
MKTEAWPQIDALLEQLLALPRGDRAAFLDVACAGDGELRRQLERLAAADSAAGTFLERPVVNLALPSEAGQISTGSEKVGGCIGPYRLLRILGQGGMGTVFLAEKQDSHYHQQVAIKIIRGTERSEILQRFRQERQALASLLHPNIARLYDGGETTEGLPYLVMEVVEGLPIDTYCDRHRLGLRDRVRLFRQVCAAVQHAHQNLVVHRDLKPGNILVDQAGNPKLLDFGIAKILDPRGHQHWHTRTGQQPMTPDYASPEQVLGQGISTASDVYSLGVLLYRLLTGRSPYRRLEPTDPGFKKAICQEESQRPSEALDRISADDRQETLSPTEIAKARGTTPKELRKSLSRDLDTIALMALRKEPQRRYGSALEFSLDLDRYLQEKPVVAQPDTLPYRLGKFVRRNRLAVGGTLTLVLFLLIFSIVTIYQSFLIAQERDLARSERAKAQQVSSFLMDLFENAGPERNQGKELTVREILDRSATEIEKLEDQPELQATYRGSIGRAYRGLGLYDKAQPLLEESLAQRISIHGESHPDVAESLRAMGLLYLEREDLPAAEQYLTLALSQLREYLDEADPRVTDLTGDLAYALYRRGKLSRSEEMARRALEMARISGDELIQSQALNVLALPIEARGQLETAEALFRESLALTRKASGATDLDVAMVINNLGTLQHSRKDLAAAEALYLEAQGIFIKVLGPDHPTLLAIYSNLARVAWERGQSVVAETRFREALELATELFGENHPLVANLSIPLARTLLSQGKAAQGEALVRSALEIYRELPPEKPWRIASAEATLGGCLSSRGQYQEAEPLLVRAYPLLKEHLGEREYPTRSALALLVEHYEARGLATEAARYREMDLDIALSGAS